MVYDYLRRYIDWVLADPAHHVLNFVLVSTQPASGPEGSQRPPAVGFARGLVRLHHGGLEDHLYGEGDQYFSDRPHGPAAAPFSPDTRDRIGLNVFARQDTRTVRVELVLLSWGYVRSELSGLRIADDVLVGDGPSVGQQTPSALYGLSLGTAVG
jgi:hypothetical protein